MKYISLVSKAYIFMHCSSLCCVWLPWIGEKGGCIIIDSTRKGKRFPDSMSKTIPMWSCVVNRSIFNHWNRLCNIDAV